MDSFDQKRTDSFEQKLLEFIRANNVQAEHLVFKTSCHSVAEAAASANASPEDFIKSICTISENDELIVAIVPGAKKLDFKKLEATIGAKVRLAKPDEMLERTGYPAGGTPAIGYSAHVYIDEEVLAKQKVYCGGGSPLSLLKIAPSEIIKINNAIPADLAKV